MPQSELLEFYEALPDYREGGFPADPYSRAFGVKTGRPVKLFNVETHMGLLDTLPDPEMRKFCAGNGYVWAIPNELPDGQVVSMSLKAVRRKAFYKVSIDPNFPLFFGMGPEFIDFKKGDIITLSEGIKDALAIKTVYKFSLAYLTARPEDRFWKFLKTLTNRFVIFMDNDAAGRKLAKNPDFDFCAKYTVGNKDAGELWDHEELNVGLQENIREIIRIHL